jgi:hypothetical protein
MSRLFSSQVEELAGQVLLLEMILRRETMRHATIIAAAMLLRFP